MKVIKFNSNNISDIICDIKRICMDDKVLRIYVSIELLNMLIKYRQCELYNFQYDDGAGHSHIFGIPIIVNNNLHGLEAYYDDFESLFTWYSEM